MMMTKKKDKKEPSTRSELRGLTDQIFRDHGEEVPEIIKEKTPEKPSRKALRKEKRENKKKTESSLF